MVKIKSFYKNKKVFITGITGFKGAWLASSLLGLGCEVYGLGHSLKKKNLFFQLNLHNKVKVEYFDIRDFNKLKKLIDKIKPSIVFHLAAQTLISDSYKNPYLTFDVNFKGTLNLLEILKNSNFTKSIVIVSSDKCYEDKYSKKKFRESDAIGGVDPYSASKSSTDIMVGAYRKSFFLKNKIGISSARSGNVIGGGDWSENRLIPQTIKSLLGNKKIFVRNPNFNRPWQHVLESIKGYLILAKKQYYNQKKYSGTWNFGNKTGSLKNVIEVVKIITKFWGRGEILIQKKKKFYEQKNLQLNSQKAQKLLGWKPTYDVKKSILITAEWYFKTRNLKLNIKKTTENQIYKYFHESKIS